VRRHIENCPRCLAGLASREEAGSLLVGEKGLDFGSSLWTKVEPALLEGPAAERTKEHAGRPGLTRRWGWAVATAFLGVFLLSFLLLKNFQPERAPADTSVARFELAYVRVGGQPANTVVYQPKGSDMIIVWAGTNN
jgi:hypothetical protein